jgi:hypothetical protein
MMVGRARKPMPLPAVPGARALADEDGVAAAGTMPKSGAVAVATAPAPTTRRKRRPRFVF